MESPNSGGLIPIYPTLILVSIFAALAGCSKDGYDSVQNSHSSILLATHMGEHPGWMDGFAAIIRTYQTHHPEVDIKLHYQPLDGFSIWAETQYLGGRGPDIIGMGGGEAHKFGARLGYLLPVTEYLAGPTPYDLHDRWMDSFYPVVWVNQEDPIYGELWSVPLNFFTIRIFYNREQFIKAGIDKPPATWTEFLAVQQKLAKSGFVPYLMPNSRNTPHKYIFTCMEFLTEMMYQNLLPRFDQMNHDGRPDGIEINAANYQGLVSLSDPEIRSVMELLKEWSKYWARGFNGLDRQQAKMLFAQGIGSMYMDGSWEAEAIAQSVTFDWDVFPMPTVTKEASPYGDGPRNDNNYNLSFSIGAVAKRRGHLDQVIDFFQYMTSAEAADTLSNYVTFISALSDYPIPDRLVPFAPDTGHPWSVNPWYVSQQSGSAESGDRLFTLLQAYMADEISLDEMIEDYTPIYRRLAEEELRFALKENRRLEKEVGERLAAVDSLIATQRADTDDSTDKLLIRLLQRRDFTARNYDKAQLQRRFLEEVLSRPPAWRTQPENLSLKAGLN